MGRKRKQGRKTSATRVADAQALNAGFKDAYTIYPPDTEPLIKNSGRRDDTMRSTRGQRSVGKMNNNFASFFRITEKEIDGEEWKTLYDLDRRGSYKDQISRLRSRYRDPLASCSSILDIGCGSGKLMRLIIKTPSKMIGLEGRSESIRMLGIDFCASALVTAVSKKENLYASHPSLKETLQMDFLRMDLIDLPRLDLSRTQIGVPRVDMILAVDVFRWIRRAERQNLMTALKNLISDTGCMISMEFSGIYMPSEYLSVERALALADFSIKEHMQIPELHALAKAVGFEIYAEDVCDNHNPVKDHFPPLVSAIFRPMLRKRDSVFLAMGNIKRNDQAAAILAGEMLIDKGFDVTFKADNIEDSIDNNTRQVVVLGVAQVNHPFILSEDPARVPFCEETARQECAALQKTLKRKGIKMFFIGIKPEPRTDPSSVNQEQRDHVEKAVKEIEKRWF